MLNGKLVSLRGVDKEDAELIREWLTEPDLLHLMGARPIPLGGLDIDKLPELFRLREGRVLAILSKDKNLVGLVAVGNFHEFNRTASIMILIGDRAEWNRGYGTDALLAVTKFVFDDLNLNCVEALVPEYNLRALKVFQKVGYQVEGTLRHRFFGRGRYWNMVAISAVREAWSPSGVVVGSATGTESPNALADAVPPEQPPTPPAPPSPPTTYPIGGSSPSLAG
jgi:RimJ/RimL family protein N-acetyltransferase